jgi:hypothetical protein
MLFLRAQLFAGQLPITVQLTDPAQPDRLQQHLGVEMSLLIAVVTGSLACWLVLVLAHYQGWKEYDLRNHTLHRFNEGICTDCPLFRVPKWMQRILLKLE